MNRRRFVESVLVSIAAAGASRATFSRPKSTPSQVAITIDDLDLNAADTPRLTLDERNAALMAALRKHSGLKAALFVCGMRVDNDQGRSDLRAWDRDGHIIGNHSYSHWFYPNTDFEKYAQDILRGEAIVEDLPHFQKLFRFPFLKEGDSVTKRDQMRAFLKLHGYRMGYVTIDTSEWAIDERLRKRLNQQPNADLTVYRKFYLNHIWDRASYYDSLARKVLGRSINHTLLIHHNLLSALFLSDVLGMFANQGWKLIDAEEAYTDPIFSAAPNITPAGESIVWALAKETRKLDAILRYPAEDGSYETPKMDKLGL
jgi:peptidoglycan/xylan/chitin deacetylase (PgdA/CDA1 family)